MRKKKRDEGFREMEMSFSTEDKLLTDIKVVLEESLVEAKELARFVRSGDAVTVVEDEKKEKKKEKGNKALKEQMEDSFSVEDNLLEDIKVLLEESRSEAKELTKFIRGGNTIRVMVEERGEKEKKENGHKGLKERMEESFRIEDDLFKEIKVLLGESLSEANKMSRFVRDGETVQVKEDEEVAMTQKLKADAVTEDKIKETSLDRNAMKTRRPRWLRTLLCLDRQTAPRRRRRGVRR